MNILHFFAVDWSGIGGPHLCIPSLIRAQHGLDGVNAALVMTLDNSAETPEFDFPVFDRSQVFRDDGRIGLPAPFDKPDLAVLQSTYIPAHAKVARQLVRLGIPYIVCPHGGMTRLAQNSKWLKKKLGNLAFFNRIVANAAAVHHLTRQEAEASTGWNRPTMIAGNGVDLPPSRQWATPGQSERRRMLFVGRLALDHKGLDLLLDACSLVRAELLDHGTQLEIYGPDRQGSRRFLSERIAQERLEEIVLLGEPIRGEDKINAFRRADVFLHTSRWEGHPIAVLEALSYGVPCLLTPGTNMAEEVTAAGAGWRVEPSAGSIADGLRHLVNLDGRELQEAGAKARQLAQSEYGWEEIGRKTVVAYRKRAA